MWLPSVFGKSVCFQTLLFVVDVNGMRLTFIAWEPPGRDAFITKSL